MRMFAVTMAMVIIMNLSFVGRDRRSISVRMAVFFMGVPMRMRMTLLRN